MLKSVACYAVNCECICNFQRFPSKRFGKYFGVYKSCLSQSTVLNPLFVSSKRWKMDLTSVIKILEQQVPPMLAEKWDNTGLLVEPSKSFQVSTILFTNDLTEDVANEAISQKSDLIISYHPPIFSALKALKQSNWKDRILMMCIQNNIALYSPHTSCDAVKDGVNDWLINCFDVSDVRPILQSYQSQPEFTHLIEFSCDEEIVKPDNLKSIPHCHILSVDKSSGFNNVKAKVNEGSLKHILKSLPILESSLCVSPLQPLPLVSCGMGRLGKLEKPETLQRCIEIIKSYLDLNHIRLAKAVSHSLETPVSVVAVCAGSGASVLKGVSADLYITGEMSHHDILDATQRNVSVILCEHSNSERGYLLKLIQRLSKELGELKLIMSVSDKDPICIV